MRFRNAMIAIAVAVLMGGVAYVASAGDYGSDMYGTEGSSMSSGSESGSQATETGELREPVETGALPDEALSPSDPSFGCCSTEGKVQTFEYGGIKVRHGIDDGP